MMQRWTVSGQRSAGLWNGVVIGLGVETIILGISGATNANPLFGIVFIALGAGLEIFQRRRSRELPDSQWRWDAKAR